MDEEMEQTNRWTDRQDKQTIGQMAGEEIPMCQPTYAGDTKKTSQYVRQVRLTDRKQTDRQINKIDYCKASTSSINPHHQGPSLTVQ